jgi:alpha-L-fucosidase
LRFAPAVKQEAPEEFVQWRSPFKVSEPVRGTLMFDFLRLVSVNAIQYIPPKGGIVEGVPDRYEIEISEDGKTWVKAAEGEFGNLRANPVRQVHPLPHKVSMRYARVKAVRALAGEPTWKGALFEFFMRK